MLDPTEVESGWPLEKTCCVHGSFAVCHLPDDWFVKRDSALEQILADPLWDIVVVGGGATGLGVAVDAATRGYRTLLVEQSDFCKSTSSKSTKLIHGGVRYLEQMDFSLIKEALRERVNLLRNAPHLVQELPFVLPCRKWWQVPYFSAGLKLYDLLAGRHNNRPSRPLWKKETLRLVPALRSNQLTGGVLYHDAQFDDARLGLALARTAHDAGATLVNYLAVQEFIKEDGRISGVLLKDQLTGERLTARARVVVNATGVFCDALRRLDDPSAEKLLALSQGIHIVVDRSFLGSDNAIILPRTEDGRVLFAIPWKSVALIGTTDTEVRNARLEPKPLAEEVRYLLRHVEKYFQVPLSESDILSVFAGLRPLVQKSSMSTAGLSRSHTIEVSGSGLLSITGGKWTTYRSMAEETVDRCALQANLPSRSCRTAALPLHGAATESIPEGLQVYGSDAPALLELAAEKSEWDRPIHPDLPYRMAEVVWAVRHEMAMTVEDVLARRTRALLLDAAAALRAAPAVASCMAGEMGEDLQWQNQQVKDFTVLAQSYLPPR